MQHSTTKYKSLRQYPKSMNMMLGGIRDLNIWLIFLNLLVIALIAFGT